MHVYLTCQLLELLCDNSNCKGIIMIKVNIYSVWTWLLHMHELEPQLCTNVLSLGFVRNLLEISNHNINDNRTSLFTHQGNYVLYHVKTNFKHLLLSGLPKPSTWKRLQHCSTIVIWKFMDVFKCFKCEKTAGKDNVLVSALGYPVCFSYCFTVIHDNFELILWYIMLISLD